VLGEDQRIQLRPSRGWSRESQPQADRHATVSAGNRSMHTQIGGEPAEVDPLLTVRCGRSTPKARNPAAKERDSYGNAGAVESVESQNQASPSFHEPLGNLTKIRRDSHIPTAPATRADGKVENQNQVSHFPTAPSSLFPNNQNTTAG
jgi:hypothetical protein